MVVLGLAAALTLSANTTPQASYPATTTRELRCFAVGPGIGLRKGEVADIKSAVRGTTGRPVLRIESPDPSDHPPKRVFEVVTLLRGNCDNGEGQRLWIRKGVQGWRVIKNVGGEIWGTVAGVSGGTD